MCSNSYFTDTCFFMYFDLISSISEALFFCGHDEDESVTAL